VSDVDTPEVKYNWDDDDFRLHTTVAGGRMMGGMPKPPAITEELLRVIPDEGDGADERALPVVPE
jgi:hypothetical protein